jgi:hypothetical protein
MPSGIKSLARHAARRSAMFKKGHGRRCHTSISFGPMKSLLTSQNMVLAQMILNTLFDTRIA